MPLSAETVKKLIAGLQEERRRRRKGKKSAPAPSKAQPQPQQKEQKKKLKQVPSLKGVSEEPI
jgi:hypothetical protein